MLRGRWGGVVLIVLRLVESSCECCVLMLCIDVVFLCFVYNYVLFGICTMKKSSFNQIEWG